MVAEYRYDAYGNPVMILDGNGNDVSNNYAHIANINPIRYRGYCYDIESGFYYLNSREGEKIVVNIFCCEDMQNNVFCVDEQEAFNNGSIEDKVLYYSSKFDEYGIPVHDGYKNTASSYILINHCPWCGKTLPTSRRDEWIETLEKLGYDVPFDESIPPKFKTSEWYKKR